MNLSGERSVYDKISTAFLNMFPATNENKETLNVWENQKNITLDRRG